jgi:hypothetical protein
MSTEITINQDIVEINVTEEVVVIEAPSGAYPLPSMVSSVFGRTGNVVAQEGDYNLTQLGDVTITSPTNNQVLKYNGTQWVNGTDTDTGLTSVGLSMPSAFSVANSPLTANGTLSVTGAGTTLEYVRGDGSLATFPSLTGFVPYTGATTNVNLGTHSLTAADLVINHVSGSGVAASITKGGSGEALTVIKTSGSGNAASITGGVTLLDELHLTTDLADAYIASAATWNAKQNAITLTTTGTSGAATLVGATLNIPQYQGVLTNPITGTGTSGQVAYFNGTNSITSNAAFAFTPTSQLLVNNSVTAASAIARGTNLTPTLTAAANSDVLVGLDINPSFNTGAFTNVGFYALRVNGVVSLYDSAGATQIRIIGPSGSNKSLFFGNSSAFSAFQNVRLYNQATTNLFVIATGDGTANPTDRFFITQGGNVGINTSGTDAGFRLDVNGTTRLQGSVTIPSSIGAGQILFSGVGSVLSGNGNLSWYGYTSSSAIGLYVTPTLTAQSNLARGTLIYPTLVAAANNDVLVGLDINPTFTNGAFTGVSNFGLRVNGRIVNTLGNNQVIFSSVSATTGWQVLTLQNTGANCTFGIEQSTGTALFGNSLAYATVLGTSNATALQFGTNAITRQTIFSNGNVGINTTTDAGFRLDVNGTARVQGVITGSVAGGSLTLGTASANTPAITVTGFYTNAGAINISNSNNRSFSTIINSQGPSNGFSAQGYLNTQAVANDGSYFFAGGAINTNATTLAGTLVGYNFTPSITSENNVTILAFRSALGAASNRWNLYMSGTAANYMAGILTIGTASPNASAQLQVDSTVRGFLPPRMTAAQRAAISSPATGLMVYQTDGTEGVYVYSGGAWKSLTMV